MAFRKKAPRKKDRKRFSRTASKVHSKNLRAGPMRGGIRL